MKNQPFPIIPYCKAHTSPPVINVNYLPNALHTSKCDNNNKSEYRRMSIIAYNIATNQTVEKYTSLRLFTMYPYVAMLAISLALNHALCMASLMMSI